MLEVSSRNPLQQIQFVCLTEPYILNNFSRTRVSQRAHQFEEKDKTHTTISSDESTS